MILLQQCSNQMGCIIYCLIVIAVGIDTDFNADAAVIAASKAENTAAAAFPFPFIPLLLSPFRFRGFLSGTDSFPEQ